MMLSPIQYDLPRPGVSVYRSGGTSRSAARRPVAEDEFTILNRMAAEAAAEILADERPRRRGRCPHCRAVLDLPAGAARRGRCGCGAVLDLPTNRVAEPPPAALPRVGLAVEFGVPLVPTDPTSGQPSPVMVYGRGCFDKCLAAVARGTEVVELWVMHQPGTTVTDTRRGGLSVWADAHALWVGFDSPAAVAAVDQRPHLTGLSVGATLIQTGRRRSDGMTVVTEAALYEVSLVDRPACRSASVDPVRSIRGQMARSILGGVG